MLDGTVSTEAIVFQLHQPDDIGVHGGHSRHNLVRLHLKGGFCCSTASGREPSALTITVEVVQYVHRCHHQIGVIRNDRFGTARCRCHNGVFARHNQIIITNVVHYATEGIQSVTDTNRVVRAVTHAVRERDKRGIGCRHTIINQQPVLLVIRCHLLCLNRLRASHIGRLKMQPGRHHDLAVIAQSISRTVEVSDHQQLLVLDAHAFQRFKPIVVFHR